MSVPSQPYQSQPTAAPGSTKFGSMPLWAMATAVIATLGGAATYVLTKNATVIASCGGERMRPGDTCETFRRGVSTGIQTYGEVLENAQTMNKVGQYIGLALVVIGVVFGVLAFLRWRQDVALRSQLRDDHGAPISSHSRTTSSSLLMILIGAGFVAGAIYCTLRGIANDSWPWYIGTVIAGAIGLGMLWAAVPSNGQLVQTFNDGIRIVTGNKVRDVPWSDVSYVIVPAKGTANHHLSTADVSTLPIGPLSDHEELQRIAQERTVQAKVPLALAAIDRGEPAVFGSFTVSREGIGHGGKTLTWQEYGGLGLHQGQVTVTRAPKGRFASTGLGTIRDYLAMINVIDAIGRRQPRATAPQQ